MKALTLILLLTSCANTQIKKTKVKFSHNVIVEQNKKNFLVKKGVEILLTSDRTTKISAPGRVSLVLSPHSQVLNKKLTLEKINNHNIDQYQMAKINNTFDQVMPEIHLVQKLIFDNDYKNALSKVRDLKRRYPKIAYLSFLEGACYSVLGQRINAKKSLEEGLKISPHNKNAKKLYRSLSGDKY